MPNGSLYNSLKDSSPNLSNALDDIYQAALAIWNTPALATFTEHGPKHMAQVEKNLDQLTAPLQQTQFSLTDIEIYILLAGCYLHDIGMQRHAPEARAQHAQAAFEMILHSSEWTNPKQRTVTLPIYEQNTREAIAYIARAHWVEYALQLREVDRVYENEKGRLRLLGLLLAMADLLDLSPVRANYFHTPHRLYPLEEVTEFHHKLHALIKGCEITAPNASIPGQLQYSVEWRDDSDETYEMCRWVNHWFTSQWRQIHTEIYIHSGGVINWSDPWTKWEFRKPIGPIEELHLSKGARAVLYAYRAEQQRIDRSEFTEQYVNACANNCFTLFHYRNDRLWDGRPILEWCEAHADTLHECSIARFDQQPHTPSDLTSIIGVLVEQWFVHMPLSDDDKALAYLSEQLALSIQRTLVLVLVVDDYIPDIFNRLLQAYFEPSPIPKDQSRVCFLLASASVSPVLPANVEVIRDSGIPISHTDIKGYLRDSHGFSNGECDIITAKMAAVEHDREPLRVYRYIDTHQVVKINSAGSVSTAIV